MAKAFALRSSNSGPQFDGNAGDVLSLLSSGKAEFVAPGVVPGAYEVACTPDDTPGFLNSKLNSSVGVFLRLDESTPGNFVITIGLATPSQSAEHDAGNSGASKALDFGTDLAQKLTLTANCTATAAGFAPGRSQWAQLKVVQGGAGSFTLAITGAKTPGGVPLALSTAVGAVDLVSLYWDGATLYAALAGLAFS